MMFSAIPSTISRFVYTAEDGQRLQAVVMHTQSLHIGFFLTLLSWIMPQNSILIFLKVQLLYTGLNNIAVKDFVKLCDVSWCVCLL